MEIQSTVRTNKNTWKLAQFLYIHSVYSTPDGGWSEDMNEFYDIAAELLKRITPVGVFT